MTYGNSMNVLALDAIIHSDLKDRMLYPQSRSFRIFSF
jgi:hypothetical protein